MSRIVFSGNHGWYRDDTGRYVVRQLVQAWWILSIDGQDVPKRYRTLKAATEDAVRHAWGRAQAPLFPHQTGGGPG